MRERGCYDQLAATLSNNSGFVRVLKTLEFHKSYFKAFKVLEIDFGP